MLALGFTGLIWWHRRVGGRASWAEDMTHATARRNEWTGTWEVLERRAGWWKVHSRGVVVAGWR